eukprot:scaffold19.g1818.t1
MSKYAELLAELGYPTVRSVQPTSYLFSPVAAPRRRWALALLAFLEERRLCPGRRAGLGACSAAALACLGCLMLLQTLQPAHRALSCHCICRRLVLFAFSNGGGSVIEQLQEIAESDPRYTWLHSAVAGMVFDSAPGYFHAYMARRVLRTEMPPGVRRWAWIRGVDAMRHLDTLIAGRSRAERYWESMLRAGRGVPQLFLYSKDDRLCDVVKLEELIAEKRQQGQDVIAVRWEHSKHVAHLRHHPTEYRAALQPFLERLRQLAQPQPQALQQRQPPPLPRSRL